MDEQLRLLTRLQEIDSSIRAKTAEKNRHPHVLAGLEQKRRDIKDRLERAEAALKEAQKAKREREKDLEAGQQKIEKLKARTAEIKTNKEYQALLKEIEAAELEKKTIEDDILSLMERIDTAAKEAAEAAKSAKDEEAAILAEQEECERAAAEIDEELKSLERKREDIASQIASPVLLRYQRLAGAVAGQAVVEALNEACSGCHMSIPPQVYVNVKKNDSIISCPHCGRILFHRDAVAK